MPGVPVSPGALGKLWAAARGVAAHGPGGSAPFARGFGANLRDQMVTQGVGGAAIGGTMMGGLNALGAEEGHRGEAFMRGAGQGALMGAVGGAVTAPITAGARVGRLKALDKALPGVNHPYRAGFMKNTGPAAADAVHAGGWKNDVVQAWKQRGTNMGKAHLIEAVAAPATLGAEFYLGNKILEKVPQQYGGMAPAEPQGAPPPHPAVAPARAAVQQHAPALGARVGAMPQQPPPAPQPGMVRTAGAAAPTGGIVATTPPDPREDLPPIIGTQLGGLAGGLSGEAIGRMLEANNTLEAESLLRKGGLPGAGAVVGTLGGYYAIKALNDAAKAEAKAKALAAESAVTPPA